MSENKIQLDTLLPSKKQILEDAINQLNMLITPIPVRSLPDEFSRSLTSNSLGNDDICHQNFEQIAIKQIREAVLEAIRKLRIMFQSESSESELANYAKYEIDRINSIKSDAYLHEEVRGASKGYREQERRTYNDPNRNKLF